MSVLLCSTNHCIGHWTIRLMTLSTLSQSFRLYLSMAFACGCGLRKLLKSVVRSDSERSIIEVVESGGLYSVVGRRSFVEFLPFALSTSLMAFVLTLLTVASWIFSLIPSRSDIRDDLLNVNDDVDGAFKSSKRKPPRLSETFNHQPLHS